jgi:hypothetical protein
MVAVVYGSLETPGTKLWVSPPSQRDRQPVAVRVAKAFGVSRGGAYAERAADPLHSARIKTEASSDLADAVASSLSGL